MSARDYALYLEAIYSALHVLVEHAAAQKRGWYHYSDGELIVGVRIELSGDDL